MKKNIATYLIIFGVVMTLILLAPYLLRVFGAASSVGTSVTICFNGPTWVEIKPSTTQSGVVGELFTVTFSFDDTDTTPPLTVSASPFGWTIVTSASGADTTEAIVSITPTNAELGTNTITVTATDGVCTKEVDFDLTVASVTPSSTGGGGSYLPLKKYIIVPEGGCVNDAGCPDNFDCQDGFCVARVECFEDTDCPSNFECLDSKCQPIAAELEKLPPTKEKPILIIPIIEPPIPPLSFFNRDILGYPSKGIIMAVRQGLLVSPSKIDLSPYNLYQEYRETDLGVFLRERPLLRSILVAVLASSFVLASVQIVRKSKKGKPGKYNLIYLPPLEEI